MEKVSKLRTPKLVNFPTKTHHSSRKNGGGCQLESTSHNPISSIRFNVTSPPFLSSFASYGLEKNKNIFLGLSPFPVIVANEGL